MVKDATSPGFARSRPQRAAVVVSARVDLSMTTPILLSASTTRCNLLLPQRVNSGTNWASGSSNRYWFSVAAWSVDSIADLT